MIEYTPKALSVGKVFETFWGSNVTVCYLNRCHGIDPLKIGLVLCCCRVSERSEASWQINHEIRALLIALCTCQAKRSKVSEAVPPSSLASRSW